ncbi:hypothetical protein QQS21_008108 [Conoideocrella luteorostrata]|uniref:Ankyrin n=1 Tax=Conoideocrella luteorostrata TaxID=1105319 RepID=A0AAJ0CM59_9HYPO|nr:hypothetical protein QQS21_008108 [Conoideocrella luteorostrata]
MLAKFQDVNGRTPLSWVAGQGRKATVELLLKHDVSLDEKDTSGRTPLSWAAGAGHGRTMSLLLEKGVSLVENDGSGRSPLSWAANEGLEARAELLNGSVDGQIYRETYLLAAETGNMFLIGHAIEGDNVDIDSMDMDNPMTLSCAAAYGHKVVVDLLLKTGRTDPDSRNCDKKTPLSLASAMGHQSIVRLLLAPAGPALGITKKRSSKQAINVFQC